MAAKYPIFSQNLQIDKFKKLNISLTIFVTPAKCQIIDVEIDTIHPSVNLMPAKK